MAPSDARKLLVWTLPTIIAVLSYLWFKKKRIGAQSDPGDTVEDCNSSSNSSNNSKTQYSPSVKIETSTTVQQSSSSPVKLYSRSLSGVDSAPIDIIIPRELRSVKSNPIVISDEDLDLEIEKIKSMKYGGSCKTKTETYNNTMMSSSSKSVSPKAKAKSPSPNNNKSQILSLKEDSSCCNFKLTMKPKSLIKSQLMGTTTNKEIEIVETELSVLNLNNKDNQQPIEMVETIEDKIHLQRQSSERDSANHSPVDVMLASPSLSSISDNHSEGSSDSGKGGSEVVTPPPSRTPGEDESLATLLSIYEFIIPQSLVGKLIGRHGCFVSQIKDKTKAHIVVKKHPANNKLKVCVVEGKQDEIDNALKMIRDKFPLKRFPDVTLEQVSFVPQISTIPLVPDQLYLKLVEGVNNDTILSCMVSPNHLFLQQPAHPSFLNLNILTNFMNICYSEANSPLLPNPIPENTICAAYSVDSWYRAIILSTDAESDTSYVKFLDYGGYAYVENLNLRQIRADFMLLPFQAAECFLANIKPAGGDNTMWSAEAYKMVADVTKGTIIYTQIVDFGEGGVPLVYCYLTEGSRTIFLNEELVRRGHAEWMLGYSEDSCSEGAVGGIVL